MSDTTDLIFDGVLCEECVGYIGNEVGYPRKCSHCKSEDKRSSKKANKQKKY